MDFDMADLPKTPEIQLQIQLDDNIANGSYVNMALVNHTETEFTMDFIYVQPQQPKARVRSRIITNPKHMKRLLHAIQDNVSKYEAKFGALPLVEGGNQNPLGAMGAGEAVEERMNRLQLLPPDEICSVL